MDNLIEAAIRAAQQNENSSVLEDVQEWCSQIESAMRNPNPGEAFEDVAYYASKISEVLTD